MLIISICTAVQNGQEGIGLLKQRWEIQAIIAKWKALKIRIKIQLYI